MGRKGKFWYYSCMPPLSSIPAFGLYGEDGAAPDSVHCERISARAQRHQWEIVPHRHRRLLQVLTLDAGTSEARVDGQTVTLKAQDLLFLPAQTVHSFRFTPDTEGLVLTCPVTVLAAFGTGQTDIQQRLDRPIWGAAPTDLFTGLRQRAEPAKPQTFHAQAMLGLALFVLSGIAGMARPETQGRHRHPVLERLDQQIMDALSEPEAPRLSPARYASNLGLSTGHLSRICRQHSGQGAAAYIEARVMDEACRLLAFTPLSVSEVGFRLGYADPSYFTRRFKSQCGKTPTDYRQQARPHPT